MTTAPNVVLTYYFWGNESGSTNTLNTPFGSNTERCQRAGHAPVLFPGFGSPLFAAFRRPRSVNFYFTSERTVHSMV